MRRICCKSGLSADRFESAPLDDAAIFVTDDVQAGSPTWRTAVAGLVLLAR